MNIQITRKRLSLFLVISIFIISGKEENVFQFEYKQIRSVFTAKKINMKIFEYFI